jgi:hypothetical protein
VISLPNIARCEYDRPSVSDPSRSRKAKEILECGPTMNWVGQIQCGCRMMCRSEQIGLHLTSLSKVSSVKIISDSGSMVGMLLKVTLDRPEDRIRCLSGKACSRVACSLWISLKETKPVNVRMKFGEAATHRPDRRISVELAEWSPA